MGKKKVGNFVLDLDEILGAGQFGKVYKAAQQNSDRIVAVKVIDKKKINEDEYTRNALVREVEIMKNLKSPNIIECLEVHETANNVYIVQELADEGTLRDMIKSKKSFPEKEGLVYIMQMLTGFAELVRNGIIHRDVKPSNILVKDGNLKLADFGFAKNTKNLSYMDSIVGTPAYMAPQVINREEFEQYSYKCDIWSFGVVCYEVLVGKLPWSIKSNNIKQLYKEIKEQAIAGVKFPEELQISTQMKNLIRGCLKFEEKDRFDWRMIFDSDIIKKNKKLIEDGFEAEEAYTKTRLRMCIHCQNINIKKLLKDMPKNLSVQQVYTILKAIDNEITEHEANLIFKAITKSNEASQEELVQYLKNHNVKTSGNQKSVKKNTESDENDIQRVIEGLAEAMEQKQMDLYDLFRKYDVKKNNSLREEQFSNLLLSLNPKLHKEQLFELFKVFDSNRNKQIEFNECYTKLCKIGQVVKVEDDSMHQSLRKLKKK